MIQTRVFDNFDDVLHFLAEERPEQVAILQHDDVWEVAFIHEPEDQPIMA